VSIDGFTLFAQLGNFLVLILLLKRFLFAPIINAMDKREKTMERAMEEAERAVQEAKEHSMKLGKERKALMQAKDRMLMEAKQEVNRWREQAMAEAHMHVENLQEIWVERVEQEKGRFLSKLKEQVTTQVIRLGGKVLRDLADENLEKQVINAFLRKLEGEQGRLLFQGIDNPFLVRSGFRINDALAEAIIRRLAQVFPPDRSVSFEVDKGLGIGIQMIAGDRRVDWNLNDYLDDLEKEVMVDLQGSSRGIRHG
jgi:F-type H+-transporting ATPase subunit b